MGDYEDILYDAYSFPEAHPRTVAAISTLHGAPLPKAEGLRVLDLGCGCGSHLLPMAEQDPTGTYIGVDLSKAQIAFGRRMMKAAGITNARLLAGDLRDLPLSAGRFDLILCHGVYSWVPADVRAAILTAIRAHLTANGVAYVSTNMLPGWRSRGTIRAALMRFVDPTQPVEHRLRSTRGLLELWARASAVDQEPLQGFLQAEIRAVLDADPAYIVHEHLAPINQAFWFRDLHRSFAKAQLAYLGDATLPTHRPLPDDLEAHLQARAQDTAEAEELRDIVAHRMFRRHLLVHRERIIDRDVHWRRLEGLYLRTLLRREGDQERSASFTSPHGLSYQTTSPLEQALLDALGGPRPLQLDELATLIGASKAKVGRAALPMAVAGLILPIAGPIRVARSIPERPIATRFARLQAAHRPRVTNLHHESILLPRTGRAMLQRCDGEHDRAALAAGLLQDIEAGRAEVLQDGAPTTAPGAIAEAVELTLDSLWESGFFVEGAGATR